MEFTTSYCPNPQCTHYGQHGFGVHLIRRGADRGIPRLLCTRCEGTFSARGIHLKRDSRSSIAYSEELISSTISATFQSTDRHHGIVGQKRCHFQRDS
jgi:hypothetical protein